MTMSGRIGRFIFFMGLFALILYVASLQSGSPNHLYLLAGLIMLVFGRYLRWRAREPAQPAARFRTVRKYRQKRAEKKEKKD